MGIGEPMAYALDHPEVAPTVGDCANPATLSDKLIVLRDSLGVAGPPVADCVAAYRAFAERVSIVDSGHLAWMLARGRVVFEGTQGVLLDEWHGFHPYTTWSTTTFDNAAALLDGVPALRLGVLRTFTTRHGPGPLITEDSTLELPDRYNVTNPWQGPFRVGHFDAVAHRYAIEVSRDVDALAPGHRLAGGSGRHARRTGLAWFVRPHR